MITLFGVGEEVQNEGPEVFGGKGANLVTMANLMLPVPPGIIIPTSYCVKYMGLPEHMKKSFVQDTTAKVLEHFNKMTEFLGYTPLVSVRSGARVSMPGMMDTVLNVGITEQTEEELIDMLGDHTFYDCKRRFYQMYGDVVLGLDSGYFEGNVWMAKMAEGVESDSELSVKALKGLCETFEKNAGEGDTAGYPFSFKGQLSKSIEAVWNSWNSPRAKHYRKMHGYPDDWGTAVNIQTMVFGNRNDESCSGVLFSRNPATGEHKLYGDFLVNAQGEDVVAGIRTPQPIHEMDYWDADILGELSTISSLLEEHYHDMQDMEFTVEDGTLWMLQCRIGKRSSIAAMKIASDMYHEGVIDKETAFSRVSVMDFVNSMIPSVPFGHTETLLTTGIPAGGGVIKGAAVFSSEAAVMYNGPCILIRDETTPNDLEGMDASVGILTKTGGTTSHAAVVARALNKVCVVGAIDLDLSDGKVTVGDTVIEHGDDIAIDGTTGKVYTGDVPIQEPVLSNDLEAFINLAIGGENFLPKGRSIRDAYNGELLIPYSLFGVGCESEWVQAIRDALKEDLYVYVTLDSGFTDTDDKILDLFGAGDMYKKTALDLRKLLIEEELWLKVQVIALGGSITLETFLENPGSVVLDSETILKVFGSEAAYSKILALLEEATGDVPESHRISTLVEELGCKFTKEV